MFGVPLKELLIMGAVIAVIAAGGWFFYSYNKALKENGAANAKIEVLQQNVNDLSEKIETLEKQREIDQRIQDAHIKDLMDMQDQLQDLNQNLGQDAEDQAATSIKEYFKRLEGVK